MARRPLGLLALLAFLLALLADFQPGRLFLQLPRLRRPSRRGSAVTRRAKTIEATDFATAVASGLAGDCDRPFTVKQLLDDGSLLITEEPRGSTDPKAEPDAQWRRFWGGFRRSDKDDEWHKQVYWRLVRGQNCQVFAAQVGHAWQKLCGDFFTDFDLQYAGQPVVGAYVFHSHVRVEDLLETTPTVYFGSTAGGEFPTYSTIGRLSALQQKSPVLARRIGIATPKRLLDRGLRMCEWLEENPDHVCAHTWFALATESKWYHIDLCGPAYGYDATTSEGWPLHTFETVAHDIAEVPPGQFGGWKNGVLVNDQTQAQVEEDARRHRHFGFFFREAGYPADERLSPPECEEADTWMDRAPREWKSADFLRAVKFRLIGRTDA